MDPRTLTFSMCIAPSGKIGHENQEKAQRSAVCGGQLIQRDALTLLCTRCGAEYPIKSGVPQLLPSEAHENSYLSEDIIQKYYEMHFGPYISGYDIQSRLSFPQPNIVRASRINPSVEGFSDIRRHQEGHYEELKAFYQSLAHLIRNPYLTNDFYQYIINLSRPLLNTESVVLDIGCGLGRMTADIAALGVTYAIGLDRSSRMAEEAAKIVGATGPIPINLKLVGGKTIGAQLTPGYRLDNVDFIVGDAECLPIREETVNLALALNLLDRVLTIHQFLTESC